MVALAVTHVSEADVQFWVGLLIVAGCLIGAGLIAYRTHTWLAPLVLCFVALFAGLLLLG